MREIKFRAWDCLDEDMQYFTFNEMLSSGTAPSLHPGSADWRLMQYTGLKDKNGKEIFEGDIVKHKEPNTMHYPGPEHVGTITYLPDVCCFRTVIPNELYEPIHDDVIIEVIGNIYENPELLEEI